VQGIAVSSYQGGHVEYFKYMIDLLRARRRPHQGVRRRRRRDRARRDRRAARYGVTRIFSPEDGQRLGLQGMINDDGRGCDVDLADAGPGRDLDALAEPDLTKRRRARSPGSITALENESASPASAHRADPGRRDGKVPVLGITGTGGAGKSSLTDELVRRFRLDQDDKLRSRSSRSTPRGARAAARCSATASG
jgi:methylmalonyl-CoA mutase